MQLPDPAATYETFLPLRLSAGLSRDAAWAVYLRKLRGRVAPVVRRLQADSIIGWYGFLIHDFGSGVPTVPEDEGWYVHLRVTLLPTATASDLTDRLPDAWRWTRPMAFPDPPYLDRVDLSQLLEEDARLGWALLGDFSEWALRFVEAHEPEVDIPYANAAQLVHYLDNMLLLDLMRSRPVKASGPAKGKDKARKNAKGHTGKAGKKRREKLKKRAKAKR